MSDFYDEGQEEKNEGYYQDQQEYDEVEKDYEENIDQKIDSQDEGDYRQPDYLEKRFDNSLLNLSDPMIKEGIKKFVIYSISGSLFAPGSTRRYSDFDSLRDKLVERWPGVYVPNIPEKKVIGNLNSVVIQRRMRLMNVFCLKLSKNKHIFECDVMQLFQSNNPDVGKAIHKLPKLNYREIHERYKEAFPDYNETYDLVLGKASLQEISSFVKKSLNSIKFFQEAVITSIEKKKEEFDKLDKLNNCFGNYEKNSLLDYANNDESKLIFINPNNSDLNEKIIKYRASVSNPYKLVNDWLEEEKLDFEALSEALDGITNLNETYDKLGQKLESIENSLKSIQFGHRNFKSLFKFKNKEATKAELENEKVDTEMELKNLHQVIKIASFQMECCFKQIKEEKLLEYYIHLKMYAEMQRNSNSIFNDLWLQVKLALNTHVN